VQVAYFVGDARAAAARMAHMFGAGPFFFAEKIELAWGEHRGASRKFLHSSAYGQWGELMLELVQQDEEGPSPFRDMYAPGQEGIHHVAMIVDSLEATYRHYADLDVTVAARAETLSGVEFAFLDTTASLGHMLEIYERSDQLQGFYSMVRRAAEGWDGAEPVRSLG
jgi:hypothetical protein